MFDLVRYLLGTQTANLNSQSHKGAYGEVLLSSGLDACGCLWIWPKPPRDFPFGFHCWHLRWCNLAGIVFKDFFLHNSLKNWSFNQTSFNCLQLCPYLFIHLIAVNTVDERHPAPVGMYKNPVNNGINYIYLPYQLVIARFLPSTVSLHLANETILNSPGLHRPLGHLSSFLCRPCRPLHLVSAGLQVYIYIYAYLQK